jgi:cell division septation protein DedD
MRNIFLALVLANLAFAAWSAWFAPANRLGRPSDEGLQPLTLVSEVPGDLRSSGVVVEREGEAPPEAVARPSEAAVPPPDAVVPPAESSADPDTAELPSDEAVAAAQPNAAEAPARCTSVGPFRELSQAATAAATLRNAGHQPVQRVAEGDVWIGYWVYIPAIASEKEANDILARVRAEGIADSYVIPNSDSGNLVSLGVFSEISGVSRRRDQVRALGFEPQVVDRTRRATVYWVDVTLEAGQTLDFDALQPPGRIIRLEQRSCEAG